MLKASLKSFCPLLCYSALQPPQLLQLTPEYCRAHWYFSLSLQLSQAFCGRDMWWTWNFWWNLAIFDSILVNQHVFQYLSWWIAEEARAAKSLELHRAKSLDSLCAIHDLGNHGKSFPTCSSGHFCSYESLLSSWTQDKWPQNTSELPSLELMTGAGCSWCSCCQWPASWFHIKDCVVACPSFSWKIKRY